MGAHCICPIIGAAVWRRANKPFRQAPQPDALRIKTATAINNSVFFISCIVPTQGTLRSRGLPKAISWGPALALISRGANKRFSTQPLPPVWRLANIALSFCLKFPARSSRRRDRAGTVVCGVHVVSGETIVPRLSAAYDGTRAFICYWALPCKLLPLPALLYQSPSARSCWH